MTTILKSAVTFLFVACAISITLSLKIHKNGDITLFVEESKNIAVVREQSGKITRCVLLSTQNNIGSDKEDTKLFEVERDPEVSQSPDDGRISKEYFSKRTTREIVEACAGTDFFEQGLEQEFDNLKLPKNKPEWNKISLLFPWGGWIHGLSHDKRAQN